jgi:hypothetical protein
MIVALVCATIASGLTVQEPNLKVQEEAPYKSMDPLTRKAKKGHNYAYVTMWVSAKNAPKFVRNAALMDKAEEKAAFKVMQEEEGLDDEIFARKMEKSNLVEKLGGESVAHQGTLKLAQQLSAVKSKYPLVVMTNDPKLLDIQFNQTKKAMYRNLIIKPIQDEDWLRQQCKLQPGNGIHYQKLNMFGMTEYDKLIWLDTDGKVRKNLDEVFDQYDTKSGHAIYGQLDDYNCDGNGDFCSGLVLFQPQHGLVEKLQATAKSMHFCWGDQRILRKHFKAGNGGYEAHKFSHKVVQWGHCNWKKADSMAVHNQRPDGSPPSAWR